MANGDDPFNLFGFQLPELTLGAIIAAIFGWPAGLAGLFGGGFARQVGESNVQAEDIQEEFTERVDVADEAAGNIGVPLIRSDGQLFGPGRFDESGLFSGIGTPGPVIDFDKAFDVGDVIKSFTEENLPSFGDLEINRVGPTLDEIRSIFSGLEDIGEFTPRSTADLLEGVDLPDTDLSEVLGARLSGIGFAGQNRESLRLQEAAREAQRSGLGLEGARRLSSQVGFEESQRRAAESSGAIGQTRIEEALREVERAGLQSRASSQAEQINAMLEQFRTGVQADVGLQNVGALVESLGPSLSEAGMNLGTQFNLFERGLTGAIAPETDELNQTLATLQTAFNQANIQTDIAQLFQGNAGVYGGVLQGEMGTIIANFLPMLLGMINQPSGGGGGGTQFGLQFNPTDLLGLGGS